MALTLEPLGGFHSNFALIQLDFCVFGKNILRGVQKCFFRKFFWTPPRNFFFDFFEGLYKNSYPKKFYFPSSKDLEITALQSFHCIFVVQMFEVLSFLSLWSQGNKILWVCLESIGNSKKRKKILRGVQKKFFFQKFLTPPPKKNFSVREKIKL